VPRVAVSVRCLLSPYRGGGEGCDWGRVRMCGGWRERQLRSSCLLLPGTSLASSASTSRQISVHAQSGRGVQPTDRPRALILVGGAGRGRAGDSPSLCVCAGLEVASRAQFAGLLGIHLSRMCGTGGADVRVRCGWNGLPIVEKSLGLAVQLMQEPRWGRLQPRGATRIDCVKRRRRGGSCGYFDAKWGEGGGWVRWPFCHNKRVSGLL
jgi:hypothetical protein